MEGVVAGPSMDLISLLSPLRHVIFLRLSAHPAPTVEVAKFWEQQFPVTELDDCHSVLCECFPNDPAAEYVQHLVFRVPGQRAGQLPWGDLRLHSRRLAEAAECVLQQPSLAVAAAQLVLTSREAKRLGVQFLQLQQEPQQLLEQPPGSQLEVQLRQQPLVSRRWRRGVLEPEAGVEVEMDVRDVDFNDLSYLPLYFVFQ